MKKGIFNTSATLVVLITFIESSLCDEIDEGKKSTISFFTRHLYFITGEAHRNVNRCLKKIYNGKKWHLFSISKYSGHRIQTHVHIILYFVNTYNELFINLLNFIQIYFNVFDCDLFSWGDESLLVKLNQLFFSSVQRFIWDYDIDFFFRILSWKKFNITIYITMYHYTKKCNDCYCL